jgi:hypothetical protein
MEPNDDFLIVGWAALAEALGISVSGVRRMQHRLPIVRLSARRPAVRLSALREWFTRQERFVMPASDGDGFHVIAGLTLSVHDTEATAKAAAGAAR